MWIQSHIAREWDEENAGPVAVRGGATGGRLRASLRPLSARFRVFEIDACLHPRALSRVRRIPVLSFPPETVLVTYSEPPNLKTSRSQRTRRLFALRLPKDRSKSEIGVYAASEVNQFRALQLMRRRSNVDSKFKVFFTQ